jgi:hypothetical protein
MKYTNFPVLIPTLLVTSILFAYSCEHDQGDGITNVPVNPSLGNEVTTGSACSPDTTYFVQQVLPVFQSSCAMSGCHDAASHKEGIVLDSYSRIIATGGINVSNPTKSKVYRAMANGGEESMPPFPANPMSSTQLATISKWIGQGAKNNSCIESGCDTSNVKYSTHIKPLIQNACQGCHNAANAGGGIDLSAYSGVKAIADNGKFFGSVSHNSGYSPMPKNGNKLTDCQINMVKIWINKGALQN